MERLDGASYQTVELRLHSQKPSHDAGGGASALGCADGERTGELRQCGRGHDENKRGKQNRLRGSNIQLGPTGMQ